MSCSKEPTHSEVPGCTDPSALNFNPLADTDDGSCEYIEIIADIDGNIYNTVIIGDQEWMIENLKVTHYRNGELIPTGFNNNEWRLLTEGANSIYDNDTSNVLSFGYLYNGYAVVDERGICPEGWQVPTDDEFVVLEIFLGMSLQEVQNEGWRGTSEGGKLKESGSENWFSPNTGATNESGFNALPAGYRSSDGNFSGLGFNGTFWSSTEIDSSNIWIRKLYYMSSKVKRVKAQAENGFAIRCMREL